MSKTAWRNRQGRAVEVLDADLQGLDGDGCRWLACCTEHGSLLAVNTRTAAVKACRDTSEFCEDCRS